jgi:hypothetical protein
VPAFERKVHPNANASTAKVVTMCFFPMMKYSLLLFRGFNATIVTKLPGKMADPQNEFSVVLF